MSEVPQREYSGGIGVFLSQVPFAYLKKSSCGLTDRSSVARSTDALADSARENAATLAAKSGLNMVPMIPPALADGKSVDVGRRLPRDGRRYSGAGRRPR